MTTTELLSWLDNVSTEWPMNNEQGVWALLGRNGVFAPPISLVEQRVPGAPGARLREVQVGVRQVDVPIMIKPPSGTPGDYRNLMRAYVNAFLNGPGILRATGPDGAPRDLNCTYVGGMEGREQTQGLAWSQEVASFHGDDPYWYDKSYTTYIFTTAAAVPFFPMGGAGGAGVIHLSVSGVIGALPIFNTGDVEAWPVWTIQGPGSSITLQNFTTGKNIYLTANGGLVLSSAQTLTIDCRAGYKSITLQDGTSQFGFLSFDSALWSLIPGENDLNIAMNGTTSASSVTLAYKRGWRTA